MNKYDTIIIGAGAAGLMCAIEAGQRGRSVLVLEKSSKAGKKILISGGGRCNFTNLYTEPASYLSNNKHFCKSALSRYTQWDFISLVDKHQLGWTEKTLGQLFCDQKAGAIVEMLLSECRQANVEIKLNCDVEAISHDEFYNIQTNLTDYQSDNIVVATGGPSIPKMGATDFAVRIAKQFGLKTYDFTAALVPFTFPEEQLESLFRELSGTAVDVTLSVGNTSFKEAILFTHRGLSGPAALQISSYWTLGDEISVNLLPNDNALDWLNAQREEKGLTHDELAFYDALETNDSAVAVLGDEILKTIARDVAKIIRSSTTIDWTMREEVQAQMRVLVKRILKKYGYPPDNAKKATDTVLEQAKLMASELASA